MNAPTQELPALKLPYLFASIDKAADQTIALLGEHDFQPVDLKLIMLGLNKRAHLPQVAGKSLNADGTPIKEDMKKRINHVEPLVNERETEEGIARNEVAQAYRKEAEKIAATIERPRKKTMRELGLLFDDSTNDYTLDKLWLEHETQRLMREKGKEATVEVITETEKGILLKDGSRLKIIDGGFTKLMEFDADAEAPQNSTDIAPSVLNELALYRGLAAAAKNTLKKDCTLDPSQHQAIATLNKHLDALQEIVFDKLDLFLGETNRANAYLQEKTQIYTSIFENKKRVSHGFTKVTNAAPQGTLQQEDLERGA